MKFPIRADLTIKDRTSFWIVATAIALVTFAFLGFAAAGRYEAGAPSEAHTILWLTLAFAGLLAVFVVRASRN